nr:protein toc75-3, chloroplastic [Quercus suber]
MRLLAVEACHSLDLQSFIQLLPEIIGLPPNLPPCLGIRCRFGDSFPNVCNWYDAVSSQLAASFPGKAVGVRVGGKGAPVVAAPAKEASLHPGGTITFEHRNLSWLNRSIMGSVTTSNFSNPMAKECCLVEELVQMGLPQPSVEPISGEENDQSFANNELDERLIFSLYQGTFGCNSIQIWGISYF